MILLDSVGRSAGQVRSADQANAMLRIIMGFALDLTFFLAKLRIPFHHLVFRSTTNRGRLILRIANSNTFMVADGTVSIVQWHCGI